MALEWLTHADFADRVGEEFDLVVDGAAVPLVLAETSESAAPGGVGPDGAQRRQFALVFRGPAAPVLPQATYDIEHAEMGSLELFLVAIGPLDGGMGYQAAFA